MRTRQFGSKSQTRKYRCKQCNNQDTVYHPLKNMLKCKACGSIDQVSSKDLGQLRIIQRGKKRRDTSGLSKIERMKQMTHKLDPAWDDHSICGIEKSGKFSGISLTDDPDNVTCRKCSWNS